MPRPASIWYRKQTGWWCVTHRGKITKLSQDKKEAKRLFHELMAKKPDEPVTAFGPTFRKLADEYLVHTQSLKKQEVFAYQVGVIQSFCDHVKRARACELKGHMVLAWLSTKKTWGSSTRALATKTLKAVCNWGVRQGYLEDHPLKKLPGGQSVRRDQVLTPDERRRIREVVSPAFADFLRVVELTGARPFSEVAVLEARHIDFTSGTATLAEHKTAKKTGRPRTLFFTDESLAVLRRLASEHPVGVLFRNRDGTAWNRVSAKRWFEKVEKRAGIKASSYVLRHTRITEAIINGVPVEVVAELVGNTPQIIHKHYAHVGKDKAALLAAAKKAAG